jgi:Histidine kinase-like ATPase domain
MTKTRRFAHAPESVPAARRFAEEVLDGTPEDVRDTVTLMISELASNCVRHTDTGFDLTLIRCAAAIRVEATDWAGGEPKMGSPGPMDPHGRGLRIVDMLSSSWGVEPLPEGGKTVWFRLTGQAPAPAESPVA